MNTIKEEQQAAISRVWDHFITQKQPFGTNENSTVCRYIGEDGRRCAIGCLLEEAHAKSLPQGAIVTSVLNYLPQSLRACGGEFLARLQMEHDNIAGMSPDPEIRRRQLAKSLRYLATGHRGYDLELPEYLE